MENFFEPFAAKWNWTGYVNEVPMIDEVRSNHRNSNIFIYCGHGAGEILCEPSILRGICCPASFLWGCSSGRLISIGIHDPFGPILSYLGGSSPWIVGNLWDVTDKDIDRLSISCMKMAFGECNELTTVKGKDAVQSNVPMDISVSLSSSRSACKMKYIVGSATVVYGMPCRITFC